MGDKKLPIVRAADRTPERELQFSHPLNPKSDIHGFLLAGAVGLKNVGVFWARVPPGKESFVYHRHHCEEADDKSILERLHAMVSLPATRGAAPPSLVRSSLYRR